MSTKTALKRRPRKKNQVYVPYLLMLPAFIAVIAAKGYPLVKQVVMSFQKYGLAQQFGKPPEWIGFKNYTRILADPYFWIVFGKSLVFCAVAAGLTMIFGVAIALLLLKAGGFSRGLLNTILIVVWAMPILASLTVWIWLIDPNFGLLNWVLDSIGLHQFAGFNWLATNYWTFFLIVLVIVVWGGVPFVTITTYAAMAQVDSSLLEAASIDGATYWKQSRYVLIPLVAPVIWLVSVLEIIWDLQVFTQVYVLQQNGGDSRGTNLLGTYVYQVGISQGKYGIASALSMIILILILIVTGKYLQILYRQGDMK